MMRGGSRTGSAPSGRTSPWSGPQLRALPGEQFETGLALTPLVDRHARITVRQCHYSVPARLVGRRVRAVLRATELVVFDGRTQVACHERSTVRGSATLLLDHNLEVRVKKPGALPGVTALAQARAAGSFNTAHEAFWAAARKAHGDAGTRELVDVLLLHRHMNAADVTGRITAALTVSTARAGVVAVEARRIAQDRDGGPELDEPQTTVGAGCGRGW